MNGVMSRMRADESTRKRQDAPKPGEVTLALLPIGADLLPRETAAARAGRGRRVLALAVVLVAVVAVAAVYALSLHSRSGAGSDLAAAQDRQHSLQTQQRQFTDLIAVKTQATTLGGQLAKLMADDAPWSTLLTSVNRVQGAIALTDVDVQAASDGNGAGGTTATTPGAIGTVTLAGTGADKATIAGFVDALATVPGLTNAFVSSVTESTDSSGFSFTAQVDVTPDLLTTTPNRWTTTTTGGGK